MSTAQRNIFWYEYAGQRKQDKSEFLKRLEEEENINYQMWRRTISTKRISKIDVELIASISILLGLNPKKMVLKALGEVIGEVEVEADIDIEKTKQRLNLGLPHN